MSAICVPVFVKGGVNLQDLIEEAEDFLEDLHPRGMIELRCDQATPRLMLEAMEYAHVPVIVTIRPTWEGGLCEKDDEYRAGLWEQAMEEGAEYVDVELLAWEKNKTLRDRLCEAAEKHGTRIILSSHDFEGRPKDLEARIARLRRVKQADVLKLAWKAESVLDGIEALKLLERLRREDGRPAVVLAMGEDGLISRVLARKFGAAFTFATIASAGESAPGQPTVETLRDLFRWESQSSETPVYTVAGWPIGHSKSPAVHSAGFESVGAPGVYVPLAVRPGTFSAVFDALSSVPGMNLRGSSVTIPHKEAAFKYVMERNGKIDDLSWRIGVLNTLLWSDDAPLRGFNSDYQGALDALVAAWSGQRSDVAGKRVAVIGAGGAARAVVAGLVMHGATAIIYNRTRDRADALAADFAEGENGGKAIAGTWEQLRAADCDAYINCTPLGMAPNIDASPVNEAPANWGPGIVVFDTVYNPPMTRFLQLAQERGATIIPGTDMFVRQAAVQFRAFTGKDAPVDLFRRVLAQ